MTRRIVFHDVRVGAASRFERYRAATRTHNTAELVPAAVAVFTRMLDTGGVDFTRVVPDFEHIAVRVTYGRTPGLGLATFSAAHAGAPITINILAAGLHPQAEQGEMASLAVPGADQHHLAGTELGLVLERPALVTWVLPAAAFVPSDDVGLVADMETCLAAAWFLRHLTR